MQGNNCDRLLFLFLSKHTGKYLSAEEHNDPQPFTHLSSRLYWVSVRKSIFLKMTEVSFGVTRILKLTGLSVQNPILSDKDKELPLLSKGFLGIPRLVNDI